MKVRVINKTRECEIGSRVELADTWWGRLRGLIGRPELEPGQGLLLTPCKAVHMYGMKYPIDAAFLDHAGVVTAVYRELVPGARSRWHDRAEYALELPAGMLARTETKVGDVLEWAPPESVSNGQRAHPEEATR